MEYAAERAARLQETLVQAAENNPNMDSPTVKVNKVREIGMISFHRTKKVAEFLPAFILYHTGRANLIFITGLSIFTSFFVSK